MNQAIATAPALPVATAYDIVDYPSNPRPQTHPARLSAIARLHGIDAASPKRCRLLEVGCGDGGNLFPMAMAYPDSQFIGVDLSAVAIARGEELRAQLGLSNLSLLQADLCQWQPGAEPLDYVIAHGFYSWVPAPVRDALLALCRDHLARDGVAYISYNALPGCHLRRMIWEMLRFHLRDVREPQERVAQALDFLRSLERDVLGSKAYPQVVRDEARQLLHETDPAVLFHDDLAELNVPLTVTDFVADARRFGLSFLGEADYYEMSEVVASAPAAEHLRELAAKDVVLKEQYLDFLKGRRFRQTLLCRANAPLQREPDARAVQRCDAVGDFTWEPQLPDLGNGVAMQFRETLGAGVSSDQPVVKAALLQIARSFPAPQSFAELLDTARSEVGHDESTLDADCEALRHALLLAFQLGLLTLTCDAPRFAARPGAQPRASALVLAQLDRGAELVTSLRPSVVRLENPLTRELVRLLDGSRDRAALLDALAGRMAARPAPPGEPARSPDWWREQLAPQIDAGLAQAAKLALLVA